MRYAIPTAGAREFPDLSNSRHPKSASRARSVCKQVKVRKFRRKAARFEVDDFSLIYQWYKYIDAFHSYVII
jgi:hypothetical protein